MILSIPEKTFDILFDLCVDLLIDWAKMLGMSYKEINIYIFCIIEPIIFLVMLGIIIGQNRILKQVRRSLKDHNYEN
jgi:hypothetical protein